ncbi:MAG: DUF1573 domain-containing protein [Flavobacterium sp.]|nr:MAG: DUF1573 domain-containing protein [Flavobacterium sp.]
MNTRLISITLISISILSCSSDKKVKKSFASVVVNDRHEFGSINRTDTVRHIFEIKNTADTPLIISKLGTSCNCASATISDSIVQKNEVTKVAVEFIPKENQIGIMNNTIIVEANTNPPYIILHVKGEIK